MATALRRGNAALAGEVLRFLLPPLDTPAAAAGGGGGSTAATAATAASHQATPGSSWLQWILGSSNQPQQQQQQQKQKQFARRHGIDSDAGGQATALVAQRAWLLLSQGKLAALAELYHSMSFLPLGLPGAMADAAADVAGAADVQHQAAAGATPRQHERDTATLAACVSRVVRPPTHVSGEELLDALEGASAQLPVWEGPEVEQARVHV